jgi:undecaprenyl-diphosphatase
MNQAIFNLLFSLTHRSAGLDSLTVFIAQDLIWFWLIILAALAIVFWRRERTLEAVVFSLSAAVIAWSFSGLIKLLLASERPFINLPVGSTLLTYATPEAFPSGHATFLFALAIGVYSYNRVLGAITVVVALFVSVARVATGLHWPVDVVGGFFLALIVALFLRYLITNKLLRSRGFSL